MAYVYRHIRLDKNEPFYIGIGKIPNYKRAYLKSIRNIIWKQIANKTDFEVEILFDDLSWDKAILKEKEFIALYGRIDNETGCLANMTDGGEGAFGKKCSNETKLKISKKNSGKKHNEITKKHLSTFDKDKASSFKHYLKAYRDGIYLGEFIGSGHCAKELNIHQSSILKYLKGKLKSYKNYHFTSTTKYSNG